MSNHDNTLNKLRKLYESTEFTNHGNMGVFLTEGPWNIKEEDDELGDGNIEDIVPNKPEEASTSDDVFATGSVKDNGSGQIAKKEFFKLNPDGTVKKYKAPSGAFGIVTFIKKDEAQPIRVDVRDSGSKENITNQQSTLFFDQIDKDTNEISIKGMEGIAKAWSLKRPNQSPLVASDIQLVPSDTTKKITSPEEPTGSFRLLGKVVWDTDIIKDVIKTGSDKLNMFFNEFREYLNDKPYLEQLDPLKKISALTRGYKVKGVQQPPAPNASKIFVEIFNDAITKYLNGKKIIPKEWITVTLTPDGQLIPKEGKDLASAKSAFEGAKSSEPIKFAFLRKKKKGITSDKAIAKWVEFTNSHFEKPENAIARIEQALDNQEFVILDDDQEI